MRRLHIRIDLPPNTEEALRNAYAPANDETWMIPLDDQVTVEHLAGIIQVRYQSRYPDFSKHGSLHIRKISDGYGMVPDRSSLVREVWEERRVGLAVEEYTVHAAREELTSGEIAYIRGSIDRGREFSMAPESSARIQKRSYMQIMAASNYATTTSSDTSFQASKRRRFNDAVTNVIDLDQSTQSQELLRSAHVAVEDSQISRHREDVDLTMLEKSPKSESPEASAAPFHSVPASQLDTPEDSSEAYESAGETHSTSNRLGSTTGSASQNASTKDQNTPEPEASAVPGTPPQLDEPTGVFDVPLESPQQKILTRKPANGLGMSSTSAMLAMNRKSQTNAVSDPAPQETPTTTIPPDDSQAQIQTQKSASPEPAVPKLDAKIRDDAQENRVASVEPRASVQSTAAQVTPNEIKFSDDKNLVDDHDSSSASNPLSGDKEGAKSGSEDNVSHRSESPSHFQDNQNQDQESAGQVQQSGRRRAAAKKSSETTKSLYEQLHQQEDEFDEMMAMPSSPRPPSLTPMIPGTRLKSVLKTKRPLAGVTSEDTGRTEKRQSVSFNKSSSLEPPATDEPSKPVEISKAHNTAKTPASKQKRKSTGMAFAPNGRRDVGRSTFLQDLLDSVPNDVHLLMRSSPASTPASAPAKASKRLQTDSHSPKPMTAQKDSKNDKKNRTQGRRSSTPVDSKKSRQRSSATPSSTSTPATEGAPFQIKGNNIRLSANKKQPDPKPGSSKSKLHIVSGSSPSPQKLENPIQKESSQSEDDEDQGELKNGDRADKIPSSADRDDEPSRETSASSSSSSGSAKHAAKGAASFLDVEASRASKSKSPALSVARTGSTSVDPESRSPARQVPSSSESDSGSEASSEKQSDSKETALEATAKSAQSAAQSESETSSEAEQSDRSSHSTPEPETKPVQKAGPAPLAPMTSQPFQTDGATETAKADAAGKAKSPPGSDSSDDEPQQPVSKAQSSSSSSESESDSPDGAPSAPVAKMAPPKSAASGSAVAKPTPDRQLKTEQRLSQQRSATPGKVVKTEPSLSQQWRATPGKQTKSVQHKTPTAATPVTGGFSFSAFKQQQKSLNGSTKAKLPPRRSFGAAAAADLPPDSDESSESSDDDEDEDEDGSKTGGAGPFTSTPKQKNTPTGKLEKFMGMFGGR